MVKVVLNLEKFAVKDRKQGYTYWKVNTCYVHMTDNTIRPLGSGEEYASKDDAEKEMEKRVLKLLKESGRTETADDLQWKITPADSSRSVKQREIEADKWMDSKQPKGK